jgi:hypothetical protein
MKKIFLIGVFILSAALCAAAQEQAAKPFSSLDRFIEKSGGEFNNREEIVTLFNRERVRLGGDFEKEVWKYLGKDVEKHYWISSFVEWDGYLQGNPPLAELSFKIKKRGVKLIGETDDKEKIGAKVTFLRDLAIASYRAGKLKSAIKYRRRAMPFYEKYDDLGLYVGATSEYDYCIFDNLEKDPRVCQEK